MSQRDTRLIGGIYRTGPLITSGGMLTIYTAFNHNTNDNVGLYVITLQTQEQIGTAQTLLQALAKRQGLYSPNVIRVLDWGIDENRAYIATDPPRGVTLQYVIDNENIDLRRSIDLIRQLLTGIQTLHKQGIHGLDLRPQLITVDTIGIDDRIQIDDIGLRALLLSLNYVSNQQSGDIGFLDPRYSAPEYITNGQIGPWSDIYQAGLLLFTLVTGRLPFVGRTPAETGVMQNSNPVPSIQQFKHDAPAALQAVIEQALAKDPSRRFPHADSFINSLNLIPIPTRTRRYGHIEPEKASGAPQPNIGQTNEMPPLKIDDPSTMIPPQLRQTEVSEIPTITDAYAYLCFMHDNNKVKRFPITEKEVIVGRQDPKRGITPDIDLSKLDPKMTVSRHHARIKVEEANHFTIEDLTSHNGTWLRGHKMTPSQAKLLHHDDSIRFGSVQTTFEIPGDNQ